MLICPACKEVVGDEVPPSGQCPKCGRSLASRPRPAQLSDPNAELLEATMAFEGPLVRKDEPPKKPEPPSDIDSTIDFRMSEDIGATVDLPPDLPQTTSHYVGEDPRAEEVLAEEALTVEPMTVDPLDADPLATDPLTVEPLVAEPLVTDLLDADPLLIDPLADEAGLTNDDPLATSDFALVDEGATNDDPLATSDFVLAEDAPDAPRGTPTLGLPGDLTTAPVNPHEIAAEDILATREAPLVDDPLATSDVIPASLDVTSDVLPLIDIGATSDAPSASGGGKVSRGSGTHGARIDATQPAKPSQRGPNKAVATRKLSVADVNLITSAWGPAAAGATERTSLKVDSQTQSGSGMGSSLVVNPRGLRDSKQPRELATGADYELLEVIGKGGMGVVYSARQASVDRMVAVKMIRPSVAANAERREKFLSEAVVTGDLDHPNIVPIYELGTNENNALFYSMKRVQGIPWSDVLGERTIPQNLEILMKVADAVAFAHANGVVHRDLKPDNVMLGDFGEVLVMDWGLALATSTFRHSEFVTGPDSMGGTPAYMAPEMATGPFELIGPASDIYLLGALLFEIATGLRPHHGKSAQECLVAAAKNEIQETEESGELVDIAYQAMATQPKDRYATVKDFQDAIRQYHSHCESVSLATRADQELSQAEKTGDYQGFAHAMFGFQEALAMWDGNTRAGEGVVEAKLAYARRAKTKGDFELGMSLLDPNNPDHQELFTQLTGALKERDARQKWLTRFKRIAAAMVVLVFGVISVALVVVAQAKNRETVAKEQAIKDKQAAVEAEKRAEVAKVAEEEQKNIAVQQRDKAEKAEKAAREAEMVATMAKEEESRQKAAAVEARDKAEVAEKIAVTAKRGQEYSAYIARIGVANAKVDENAFDTAESLLAACLPSEGTDDLRDWEWGHLKRICRQGKDYKAEGTVSAVAFAPDRSWFVTAGEDGKAHVWDRATDGSRPSVDHGSYIRSVAVSPDSKSLAVAGDSGIVRIATVNNGSTVHELKGHTDRVLHVAYSPNGRWLVSASRDRTVRVWDTLSGREVSASPLRGHSWWVWSAEFSPETNSLITAGQDGKVIVWSFDARAGQPKIEKKREFVGHSGPVFAAVFSPDGTQVASGGYDKRVLLWDPTKVEDVNMRQLVGDKPVTPQASRALEGHSGPVRSLQFAPDGQVVLSGGDDNTVRLWDTMTGRARAVLRGHSRPVQSCALAPDGQQVLSGAQEGQIKLWNLVDYKEARALAGRVLGGHDDAILSATFSGDGKRIVTASRDHTASVYDATTARRVQWLKEGHEFLASRAIYFSSGKRLLTSGGDSSIRIWDTATGSQMASLEQTGRTAAAAVSSDGKWILTAKSPRKSNANEGQEQDRAWQVITRQVTDDSEPRIALWDVSNDGKKLQLHAFSSREFGTGHQAMVSAVAISPDKRWLFSGDEAGVGKLWNAETGEEAAPLKGHASGITDACFTPDSKRLLTASFDGTVAHWDVATGRATGISYAHADARQRDAFDIPVRAIAISATGKLVLTLCEETHGKERECIVRLWNIDQATPIRELYRGDETVTSIAFGDDRRTALAAATLRKTDGDLETTWSVVRRWDLETGREVAAAGGGASLDFQGRRDTVWAAIDAPGGEGVLTVGGNGAALWDPQSTARPQLVFKPHSGVTSASFSASGKWIVTGSSDNRAKIWNAASGQSELQLPAEHRRPITSAHFSPRDENLLVTASADGTARIWELPARKVRHVLSHSKPGAPVKALNAAIFSPDGKSVLTAGKDGTARLWDVTSGKPGRVLKMNDEVLSVAFSRDGKHIVAGAADGTAMLFDVVTGAPLVRYLGHTAAINAVAVSPDGRRVVTGSSDRTAKLWDTEVAEAVSDDALPKTKKTADNGGPARGNEVLTLRHHDEGVTSVAFSPDGRTVLTAGFDGSAVLWLTDAWKPAAKASAK